MRTEAASLPALAALPAIALFAAISTFSQDAAAQRQERQGNQVVEDICGACHATGKEGAPRIGDANAWASRASQGLTALTDHALKGIRKMPAHGGSPGVSDTEIERAIVYMVNQSGGNWVEPLLGAAPVARTGESIVQAQCAKCHQGGVNGAPLIGDVRAWTPRLAKGMDRLVASAVHGHGPMPARGGMPDLRHEEIREAIVYMFHYGLPTAVPQPVAAAVADPHHKVVNGMDVYFGMIRAEAVRQAQADKTGAAKLAVPSGRGYYHLNIALADNKSHVPISDAQVTLRVSDGMTLQSKALGPLAANNAVSYGNFFRFDSGTAYNITAEIKRPNVPGTVVAKFEYKAP